MTNYINYCIGDHQYTVLVDTIKKCGELSKLYIETFRSLDLKDPIYLDTNKNGKHNYISFEFLLNYLDPSFQNSQNYNSLDHYWILDDILFFLGITTDDLIENYLNANGIPTLYAFTTDKDHDTQTVTTVSIKDVLNGCEYLTTKSHYKMLVGNCLITKPVTIEQIKLYLDANWLEPTRFTRQSTMTMLDYKIKIWLDTAIKMCQNKSE